MKNLINNMLSDNHLENYDLIKKIGEGAYGLVFSAIHKKTKKPFAIKQISLENENDGVPRSSIREIALLKTLDHPNIVKLFNIINHNGKLFMVFEIADMDLKHFINSQKESINIEQLKQIGYQLFRGLAYLHNQQVLHRDIKPQNILLDNKEDITVKICDFGLARAVCLPAEHYTPEVTTLWYRAPEVLLGAFKYNYTIDVWSAGCVLAELLTQQPLFPGKDEKDTLGRILLLTGEPDLSDWKGLQKLPNADILSGEYDWDDSALKTILPELDEKGLELFRKMLCFNPKGRISALEVLQHEWFDSVRTAFAGN